MKKSLRVSLTLFLVLLLVLSFSFTALAERDLTAAETAQFNDAVQFLRDSGETETADMLAAMLAAGKIQVEDPQNDEQASVGADGSLFISPSQFAALPKNATDFMKWKKTLNMAQMLFHEAVHVRQAPNSEYFDPELRRAEDWVEAGVAMEICTGPDALEVEAYYKEIQLKTKWYQQIKEQIAALEGEASEEMIADLDRKKDYIKNQIREWASILKEHNYEKGNYLADIVDELSDDELIDGVANELEERIAGLFGEGGPYERAREAYRNRENLESADSSASDGETMPHGVESGVTVAPQDSGSTGTVTTETADDNPAPKPGYTYPYGSEGSVLPLGTSGITITGASDSTGVGAGWEIGFLYPADGSTGYLYALGLRYPNQWLPLQDVKEPLLMKAIVNQPAFVALFTKSPSYIDVPAENEYYDIIEYLLDKGIMLGMGNSSFGYGQYLTRAQFATLLVRALEYDLVTTHPFTDVPQSKWYHDYVATAYQNSLIQGIGNNLFAPEDYINRMQCYTILIRALGLEEEALLLTEAEINAALAVYTDQAEISAWARPYVAYALINSMIKDDDNHFGATEIVTRQEAAQAIYTTMKRIYPLR